MKIQILTFLFLFAAITSTSQDYTLKVWPGGAPDNNGMTLPEEKYDGVRVRNVSEAEMYVFLPAKDKNTGAAVVICPGGGYVIEAMDHEGYEIAKWLANHGIAGIVLKYRLPYGHHQIPSGDARRTIRTVRHHAASWGIHPSKIGLAGSSAGGHLAATAGTRFDKGNPNASDPVERMSCRPDFLLLLYPVISFREDYGHIGSRKNLIGEGNNWELVRQYSNEYHVTRETPPAFIILADDDKGVVPRHSVEFFTALKENKVPAELHIFAKGGHGFGLRNNNIPADRWPEMFLDFLKANGFVESN